MVDRGTVRTVAVAGVLFAGAWLLYRGGGAPEKPRVIVFLPDAGSPQTGDARPAGAGDADADEQGRQAFGEEMERAAKAADPARTVQLVADRFSLEWEKGELRGEYRLDRSYREYAKLPDAERAAFVRKRAAGIAGPQLPATFAEAEAKLVPIVRERISYEVARIMASPKPHVALRPEPPHVALTDDLWGVLAYETEDQFLRIEAEVLGGWNVSFDKVWPEAVERLEQRSQAGTTYVVDGVRELRFKDGNDSARVLFPSLLAKQPLPGGAVAAMPKEDMLLVAGAEDGEALQALGKRLLGEWDRGAQNARLVRVGEGKATPFAPTGPKPLEAMFTDLRRSTEQRDEGLQREALKKRLGEGEDAPFVTTVMRAKNPTTDVELTVVVHTEGVDSLIARADYVWFKRVDVEKRTATTLGCGAWDAVYPLMKGRWKETPLHPARWLATSLPTAKELKGLRCDHPALRDPPGTTRTVP